MFTHLKNKKILTLLYILWIVVILAVYFSFLLCRGNICLK